jgi:lysozyme
MLHANARLALPAIALATGLVVAYEGMENKPYKDIVGVNTVCYGYTTTVDMGRIYSNEECKHLLNKELLRFHDGVSKVIHHPIPDTSKAAFISLAYNVGLGNIQRSTLAKKANRGDVKGACEEIKRWVYVGGKDCRKKENKCSGIVRRRDAEYKLCTS